MKQTGVKILLFTILVASLVCIWIFPGFAQIYRWIDEEGVINFTDNPDKIPERYRGRFDIVILSPLSQKEEITVLPLTPSPPREEADLQGHGREWWHERVRGWEEKRDQAIAQLEKLNLELQELRFRNILYTEQNRILGEIQIAEQERQEAEQILTEILPEEARKAGALPGWLR